MAPQKVYAEAEYYEKKLDRVMSRLGVEKYDWDYNRTGSWVEFYYKGQLYRFEHSVENARNHGVKLNYGSDTFAQIILALEDLARIVGRGIYDLQNWVSGMKALPAATYVPEFFLVLGFDRVPTTVAEVEKAYRAKVKVVHPDTGGNSADFMAVQAAYKTAKDYVESGGKK